MIHVNLSFSSTRAMAQAVSCRPVTTEPRVRSQVSPLRFVVDNVAQGQMLLPALMFLLSVSFQQRCPLIFVCMLLLPEGQTGEPWKPPKKQCSFGNLRAADRKVFLLCLVFTACRCSSVS
jgi:hypothetical protein